MSVRDRVVQDTDTAHHLEGGSRTGERERERACNHAITLVTLSCSAVLNYTDRVEHLKLTTGIWIYMVAGHRH